MIAITLKPVYLTTPYPYPYLSNKLNIRLELIANPLKHNFSIITFLNWTFVYEATIITEIMVLSLF